MNGCDCLFSNSCSNFTICTLLSLAYSWMNGNIHDSKNVRTETNCIDSCIQNTAMMNFNSLNTENPKRKTKQQDQREKQYQEQQQ